jgi:hypothetical protein
MSKTESSVLTGFDGGEAEASLIERYHQSFQILRAQGYCTYGEYPWDWWEKRALSRGVRRELAGLGRAVMREADQHLWEPRLQALCGWEDDGEAMIELALAGPGRAFFTWQTLLDTDGCRGSWNKETGEWVSWL